MCFPGAMGSEKGIKSFETGGTDEFDATWVLKSNLGSSERSAGALNC